LCLPPVLPILFTLLLFLGIGRRFLWFFYLTAWGLVAAFSLSLFIESWYFNRALFLWRAGLCGVVAVVLLAGEILIAIRQLDKDRGLLLQ
jgi:NhaP-type Na+/H+ or K+/H+ antiporter